jgi:hypothetical protein
MYRVPPARLAGRIGLVARQHWLLVVLAVLLTELVWGVVWALDRPLLLYFLP